MGNIRHGEAPQLASGRGVPEADDAIAAARNDGFAVGSEGEAINGIVVMAPTQSPQAQDRSGGEGIAIKVESW